MKVSKTNILVLFIFITLSCFTLTKSQAQNWGVGLRLGDPSGISIKKYNGDKAIELNVGRTHVWGKRSWDGDRYNDWYKNKNYGYVYHKYRGYEASTPIGIQLHFLKHNSIGQIADESVSGLDWYYGFGPQLRFQTYRYYYEYFREGDSQWQIGESETEVDFDLGLDGVIGLEYTFDDAPISVFTDITLFMEVVDNPFKIWFQGGIGARYNF